MFLCWAIEPKQKRGIFGISEKGQFRKRKCTQTNSPLFPMKSIMKLFIVEKLPKYEENVISLSNQAG